jgi:hypothetical protein
VLAQEAQETDDPSPGAECRDERLRCGHVVRDTLAELDGKRFEFMMARLCGDGRRVNG